MDGELRLPSNGQGSTQDKQILGFRGFGHVFPPFAAQRIDWIRAKAPFEPGYSWVGGPRNLGRKKEPSMMIIGCDFHPSWQQVAWVDTATGETAEQKLVHASGD